MKKQIFYRTMTVALTAGLMLGSSLPVFAAPKKMKDGGIFDAEFYAWAYPDITQQLGNNESNLYNHYKKYGKAEGRLPYATVQYIQNYTNTVIAQYGTTAITTSTAPVQANLTDFLTSSSNRIQEGLVSVDNVPFEKALSFYCYISPEVATFTLDKPYNTLDVTYGVDQRSSSNKPWTVRIMDADTDRVLYEKKSVTHDTTCQNITLNVQGVKNITMLVTPTDGKYDVTEAFGVLFKNLNLR